LTTNPSGFSITYRSKYTAVLADRPLAAATETVTIAGKHCESGDVLLPTIQLPASQVGDVLCVFATGAYNYSMSSNYNRLPRPAGVMIRDQSSDAASPKAKIELILKRESPEELLRNDLVPSWLQ
jgi:diaminopimelate decarboxylase